MYASPETTPRAGEMRQILLSAVKFIVSGALLYLALRNVDLTDLASPINLASRGWIGATIAVTFLQIFIGVLRWREITAEYGALLTIRRAMRFNLIGTFFNQKLIPPVMHITIMSILIVGWGDTGARIRPTGRQRGRARLVFVWRRELHRWHLWWAGVDLQRQKSRAALDSNRASRLSSVPQK
jgi:hypothetical protein